MERSMYLIKWQLGVLAMALLVLFGCSGSEETDRPSGSTEPGLCRRCGWRGAGSWTIRAVRSCCVA